MICPSLKVKCKNLQSQMIDLPLGIKYQILITKPAPPYNHKCRCWFQKMGEGGVVIVTCEEVNRRVAQIEKVSYQLYYEYL